MAFPIAVLGAFPALCCLLGQWVCEFGLAGLAVGLATELVALSRRGRSLDARCATGLVLCGLLLLVSTIFLSATFALFAGAAVGVGGASLARRGGDCPPLSPGRTSRATMMLLSIPALALCGMRLAGLLLLELPAPWAAQPHVLRIAGLVCVALTAVPIAALARSVSRGRLTQDEAQVALGVALGICALVVSRFGYYGSGTVWYPLSGTQPLVTPVVAVCALASLGGAILMAVRPGVPPAVRAVARALADDLALSDREVEVLLAMASGRTVRETAEVLGLSAGTVSTYRRRVFAKAGVSGVVELEALLATRGAAVPEPAQRREAHLTAARIRRLAATALLVAAALPFASGAGDWSIGGEKPFVALGALVAAPVAMVLAEWVRNKAVDEPLAWALLVAEAALAAVALGRSPIRGAWGWALYLGCGLAAGLVIGPRHPAGRALPFPSRSALLVASGAMAAYAAEGLMLAEKTLPLFVSSLVFAVPIAVADAGLACVLPLLAGAALSVGPLWGSIALPLPLASLVPLALVATALESLALVLALRDVRLMVELGGDPSAVLDDWLRSRGLTGAEREVALRLGRGEGVPAIADELFCSRATVATHRRSVYRKLEVHSQRDLIVLLANKRGAMAAPRAQ